MNGLESSSPSNKIPRPPVNIELPPKNLETPLSTEVAEWEKNKTIGVGKKVVVMGKGMELDWTVTAFQPNSADNSINALLEKGGQTKKIPAEELLEFNS